MPDNDMPKATTTHAGVEENPGTEEERSNNPIIRYFQDFFEKMEHDGHKYEKEQERRHERYLEKREYYHQTEGKRAPLHEKFEKTAN